MVASYYAAAVAAPDRHRALLLSFGTLAFAAAYLLARARLRVGQGVILGVSMGSFLLLAMPLTWRTPIREDSWIPVLVGVLAADGIWGSVRLPTTDAEVPSLRERLVTYIGAGVGVALCLCLIAGVVFALAFVTGHGSELPLPFVLRVFGGYVIGGLTVGTFAAVLLPLSRWPVGTIMLGFMGGGLGYGAIIPAVQFVELQKGDPMSVPFQVGVALACGALVGPPVALAWRYHDIE